ncbi:MAG: hypothetical protein NWF01_08240 [Candidatus Bathyarchaeota archaeon]|nr:hypothetical protein [Candidatus Bathyarchaeota archaeon]
MIKALETVTFTCPECLEEFEFDAVQEHQFVPCPLCGIDCITVREGQNIQLQCFEACIQEAKPRK